MPDPTLQEYLTAKKELDSLERRSAVLEGEEREHLRRLKEDHGVSSPEEGAKLLKKLEREEEEARAEFEKRMKEFKVKWGEKV